MQYNSREPLFDCQDKEYLHLASAEHKLAHLLHFALKIKTGKRGLKRLGQPRS